MNSRKEEDRDQEIAELNKLIAEEEDAIRRQIDEEEEAIRKELDNE